MGVMAVKQSKPLLFNTYFLMLWTNLSSAYPGGVPDAVCHSMFPTGHAASAQTERPPFSIILSKSFYSPGETIEVYISRNGASFRGLYVQARSTGCHVTGHQPLGAFTATAPGLQTRHCFGLVHSAVSHTTNVRRQRVKFYWTAPVVSVGHVLFRATIVEDVSTFWTEVESQPLVDLHSSDPPRCVERTQSQDNHSSRTDHLTITKMHRESNHSLCHSACGCHDTSDYGGQDSSGYGGHGNSGCGGHNISSCRHCATGNSSIHSGSSQSAPPYFVLKPEQVVVVQIVVTVAAIQLICS